MSQQKRKRLLERKRDADIRFVLRQGLKSGQNGRLSIDNDGAILALCDCVFG